MTVIMLFPNDLLVLCDSFHSIKFGCIHTLHNSTMLSDLIKLIILFFISFFLPYVYDAVSFSDSLFPFSVRETLAIARRERKSIEEKTRKALYTKGKKSTRVQKKGLKSKKKAKVLMKNRKESVKKTVMESFPENNNEPEVNMTEVMNSYNRKDSWRTLSARYQ